MIIDLRPGTPIKEAAEMMVAMATEHKCSVSAAFNRSILHAGQRSNAEDIISRYRQDMEERQKRYEASAEGKKAELESQLREQLLRDHCQPGLSIYSYALDNCDGRWKKLERKIYTCFELWDGTKSVDACIGLLPQEWLDRGAIHSIKVSPERRFV